MQHTSTTFRTGILLSALIAMCNVSARPTLESTCGGGIPIDFVRKCDKHADKGYVPLRRQMGGSCLSMCCQQDTNGGIVCTSDPDSIIERAGIPGKSIQPAASAVTPAASGAVPNKR
jgi:hypothetical protein